MKRRMLLVGLSVFMACAMCFALLPSLGLADDVPDANSEVTEVVDGVPTEEQATGDTTEVTTDDATQETPAPEGDAQDVAEQPADQETIQEVEVPVEETERAAAERNNYSTPSISYRVHCQTYGWQQGWKRDGEVAGTTGQSKRLEAINIAVDGAGISGGVAYKVHCQTYGWMGEVADGAQAGTTGQSKRLEGIEIRLTGDISMYYDVEYRVHCQTYGWMDWVRNGEMAGTSGQFKRLEAIQVRLVPKDMSRYTTAVSYQSHAQTYGWLGWMHDGDVSGTTGQSKRLEAVRIAVNPNVIGVSGGIRYRAHCQTFGWLGWAYNGALAGTTGQYKRVEAVQIELTGELANQYDVYYQAHCQTYGWMGWVKNGEVAGTTGQSKRIEALRVMLVKKGEAGPDATGPNGRSLIYIDSGHGPSGFAGYDSGAVGVGGIKEADLNRDLVNRIASIARNKYGLNVYPNIDCNKHYTERQAHAKSVGATSLVSIHFNWSSGGASGFESYIYRPYDQYNGKAAPGSEKLQDILHSHLKTAFAGSITDRGKRSDAFAVVNGKNTGIPAALLEVCFVSSQYDMNQYNAHKDAVANELAAALYEAYQNGF